MALPTLKTIALFAIGPDGEKQSWSSFLGPMHEALIVVQLTFDNDVQGIAGLTMWTEHEFDQTAFHSASLMCSTHLSIYNAHLEPRKASDRKN